MTWLESEALDTLRELYRGYQQPISVESVEFTICAPDETRSDAAETFRELSEAKRLWAVFDVLKKLAADGRAVRRESEGETIAEQLFVPATLLEALAEA